MTQAVSNTKPETAAGGFNVRQVRLLNQAKKDPRLVLRDRRCRKAWFCRAFFDHCHGLALRQPQPALKIARIAVKLAEQTGDRHLEHRAQGVLAHAHINREERDEATQVLEDYRAAALTCCESCASDWHLRHGDLLVEGHDPEGAGSALEQALASLGPDPSADQLAYICFIRCIQHFYADERDAAIADAGTALRDLALTRPRSYFIDTLAFLACFLQRGGERHHVESVPLSIRRPEQNRGQLATPRTRSRTSIWAVPATPPGS